MGNYFLSLSRGRVHRLQELKRREIIRFSCFFISCCDNSWFFPGTFSDSVTGWILDHIHPCTHSLYHRMFFSNPYSTGWIHNDVLSEPYSIGWIHDSLFPWPLQHRLDTRRFPSVQSFVCTHSQWFSSLCNQLQHRMAPVLFGGILGI